MKEMTLRDAAQIVGGRLTDAADPDTVISGPVEFDSRKVRPGGLFLALPGERVDGVDFIPAALESGAVVALTAAEVDAPAIVVPRLAPTETNAMALAADTDGSGAAVLAALGALARANVDQLREHHGLRVVGLTGSAGKTSTKDLIASVLEPAGAVVAPPGSFNNEIGHPWTALRADESTDFLVLELSARAPGNIAALTEIAPLDIGAVLNVGTAHLGEFGSRDVIAQTKGELVEALPASGLAILNADDDKVAAMATRTHARVCTVGLSAAADVYATAVEIDDEARASFVLNYGGETAQVRLKVHGEHQVSNALVAASVAIECGQSLAQVAESLSGATARSTRRMDVQTRADGVTIINDSYNANPDSVKAALRSVAVMARTTNPPRSTWAVLGEMGELGDESITEHDLVGRYLVRLNISHLIVVGLGRPQRALFQGAIQEGSWGAEAEHVATAEDALAILNDRLAPGDVVLVKASQAVGLWTVAESLLEDN
ncbi:MAG TPA: UDP-N-acetylmuramoyl-tripeptide--D-alanyl-D-alanine ligase [Dietzia timorensis]|uniref:UDP-N-acetylmuramoyl-tripeptide--D-alanyl-D-alanine ligase n=1 Tax=Dietzia timorensis TaxID=499555 RepID=A0A921F3W9_9ACTN|nr:UDP-N-acetylmuramoyl-tripeptide--D-alanyl-D-alanine ligase [Dietzia timorensis]HJE90795.1 UDP-N-acetylmuramoyl-tripeptide--D-alanyl-D-alanine ligase [Dietzia timorensis]